jgi:hypothetical protein
MYGIDDLDRAIFLERCHMIHRRMDRPGWVLDKRTKKFLRRGAQLMSDDGAVTFQQKFILEKAASYDSWWVGYEWRDGKIQAIIPPQ